MAQLSSIEWTDVTWNPVAGCTVATAGCSNCYAMRMAARLEAMGLKKYQGLTRKSGGRYVWTGKVINDENSLRAPLSWRKPRRVFVNSMSDLFHENVPTEFIQKVWSTMAASPVHTFQVLTKRSDRMMALLSSDQFPVLKNVWVGTSVESEEVLYRVEDLRRTPASTRFVSFEPLIGSVGSVDLSHIHWAIVGGESGPRSRKMDVRWVEEIEKQCRVSGTAFFFKQWGGRNKKAAGRLFRGVTFDEMPMSNFL